jgi:predicted acetyltransferase
MNIEVREADIEDKPVLRHLLELCQHDYSEHNDADVNEHGLFGYPYLDHYWTEPGRYPFLIRVSGRLAGFVLVRRLDSSGAHGTHSIAEFFILRKYRRQGIGQAVAQRIFGMFSGTWRVHQEAANLPAQAFWRTVISRYTGGKFREAQEAAWNGPIQEFTTR